MRLGLIVTTYNRKEALDLVLESVARQSLLPDEVLIADDGSRPETGEVVAHWRGKLTIPVRHVWQEDEGFRLARSRNRAIAAADGDYLVIVDGDMILHRHFIADHRAAARQGFFIQGARAFTNASTAERMLQTRTLDLSFFARGIKRRRHTVRNRFLRWLFLQQVRTDQKAIRGSNQAFWKADLIRVNGFDEAMTGWGGEDNELAARLYHVGIRRRNLKFGGLAVHLYHPTRKPNGENPNHLILAATLAAGKRRCELGLSRHLPPAQE